MRKVNIRQLQAHISEELKALPFMITRRGKPVAAVLDPGQVSSDGVYTGKVSTEGVSGSNGLTKEEKRVALRKIIENPKTRDADKVKAIAEDNRLDIDTKEKEEVFSEEHKRQLMEIAKQAMAERDAMLAHEGFGSASPDAESEHPKPDEADSI